MTAPTKPATALTTREQLQAERAKVPVGTRTPEMQRILQEQREMAEMGRAIANMSWGRNLGADVCLQVAKYCREFGIDAATEVEILGGRIYRKADYFIRRGVELRRDGLIRDHQVLHINADPRLAKLAEGNDEIAKRAALEIRQREFLRIKYNIPDEAKGAVCITIWPTEGPAVEGANYAGSWGNRKDPVGENDPGKTAETRAWRRAWKHLIDTMPQLKAREDGADEDGKALSQVVRAEIKRNAEPADSRGVRMIEPGTAVIEQEPESVSGVGAANGQSQASEAVTPTSARTDHQGNDAEWALNYQVPIGKSQGMPIGDLSLEQIDEGIAWCERKLEKQDSPGVAEFHAALTTALSVKMQERAAANPIPPTAPDAGEVFGDGSFGAVLPGEVEAHNAALGGLPLGDVPAKSRNALREG